MRASRGRRRAGAVVLLLGLLGTVLSACGGDDPHDDAPRLERAWSVNHGPWTADPSDWVAGNGRWIFHTRDGGFLTAVDLADGSQAWRTQSGQVCALSEINEAGLLAVQTGESCRRLTVIDTASGEQRWSTRVRFPTDTYPTDRGLSVGVSEKTATVHTHCGVERWSLADGDFLGRLRAHGTKPDDAAEYCQPAATSGALALVPDRTGLTAYDVDSGERLWHRRGKGAAAERIYATDPLLADVSLNGVRAVRDVDPATGKLGPVLGRPLAQYGRGPSDITPVGATVVGQYGSFRGGIDDTYASTPRAWDADTGEEAWVEPAPGETYLGSDASGSYLGRTVDTDDGYTSWVRRRTADGSSFEPLGWIDDPGSNSLVVDDLLITGGGAGGGYTTAYRLPDDAAADVTPPDADRPERDWAEGDLRPDPTVDPCTGVRPETLRALGFDRAARQPAPLDCRWAERGLDFVVQVSSFAPSNDATAVEAAEEQIQNLDGTADLTELDGLGDQARLARTRVVGAGDPGYAPGVTSGDLTLVVRRANVVVQARYQRSAAATVPATTGLPVAPFLAEEAVVAAIEETFAAWDEESAQGETPDPGTDGDVTALPDLCTIVDAEVRDLLPGVAPRDLSAPGEERLRGCFWQREEYDPFVQVVAYAVGPSTATGAGAEDEAGDVFAASADEFSDPVDDGPWDEAVAAGEEYGADGFDEDHVLTVRSGNVVLAVQIHFDERATADTAAKSTALARRLLRAIHR